MALIFAVLVFVAIVIGLNVLGLKLWIKPKEAIERVSGVSIEVQDQPEHPSLCEHVF